MSDVAHVQFDRGGLVMPAHSPYDRQLLREHLDGLLRPLATLRLAVDGNEWTVTRPGGTLPSCTACSQPLRFLRCWRSDDRKPVCIECVLQPAINDEGSGG